MLAILIYQTTFSHLILIYIIIVFFHNFILHLHSLELYYFFHSVFSIISYFYMVWSLPTESQNDLTSFLAYYIIVLFIAIFMSCTHLLSNAVHKFLWWAFFCIFTSCWVFKEFIIFLKLSPFSIFLFISSSLLLYVAIFCSQLILQLKL